MSNICFAFLAKKTPSHAFVALLGNSLCSVVPVVIRKSKLNLNKAKNQKPKKTKKQQTYMLLV